MAKIHTKKTVTSFLKESYLELIWFLLLTQSKWLCCLIKCENSIIVCILSDVIFLVSLHFLRLFTFGNFILVLKMAQNETLISIDLVRDKGYSMPYLKGRKVNGSNHDVEWTEWSRCITTRRQVHQSLVWESDPSPSSAGRLIEHHTLNTSLICEKSMGGWSLGKISMEKPHLTLANEKEKFEKKIWSINV